MSDTLESVVGETRQTQDLFHRLARNQYVILEFCFVQGYVQNSRFIYIPSEKQLYSKTSNCIFGIKYRCYDRKCKSRIIFNKQHNMCIKLVSAIKHYHDDSEKKYNEFVGLNNMKRMCSDIRTIAPSKKMVKVPDIRKRALEE